MTEQETIKKIQAAVPEIMELKFGCKVKTKFNEEWEEDIIIKKDDWSLSYKCLNCGGFDDEDKRCEIIGRDITMEDVLVAIEDTKFSSGKFSIGYGIVKFMFSGKEMFNWKLNKSFHEQSDETKEFIGNLLT